MPSCKECIYFEVCSDFKRNICQSCNNRHNEYKMLEHGTCDFFKNETDYNREQYAKGYCDGMSAIVEKIKEKYGQQDKFIPQKIITITGLQLNNLLKEMAGEN